MLLLKKVRGGSRVLRNSKHMTDFLQALDIASIVAITNDKGIITYVNDTFCNISGYAIDELIGKTHRIVNSGFHPKCFFKNMWEKSEEGTRMERGN